jgi:hypothetical protein
MGERENLGLRGFQIPHPQVWYIIEFSSSSWTFWYHTWPPPNRTWPLLANSRREWSDPTCDTSLNSEHWDEHFDASLDHLSQIVLGLFNFSKNFKFKNHMYIQKKNWITREPIEINARVRHQNAQLDVLSSMMYHLLGLTTPVGSWPEVVRFGSEVVKCGIKMFISMNWIQWCITLGGGGSVTPLDPSSPFHPM